MVEEFKEKYKDVWESPVTVGMLLEYTDSFLLPKFNEMLKENNSLLEHNLKTYIDRKFTEYQTDLFKKLDASRQRDTQFKEKIIEIFKRRQIASDEEIAYLEGLAYEA
ncbi:MAG: hypothetical protein Q8P11_00010 [bacterium]|nr:hypothetical protein [bacterium]